ncbi:hypothetical protein [Kribbella sp.]|uniref:hypothetical protein n=1 Tax=Kribbella sp. TaxID=1871183 RepID=UPI002D71CAE6|nr:hypothetical protein [Kribbella sp.]HZX07194.1 hypothetical protein [Kribbella sp.]
MSYITPYEELIEPDFDELRAIIEEATELRVASTVRVDRLLAHWREFREYDPELADAIADAITNLGLTLMMADADDD